MYPSPRTRLRPFATSEAGGGSIGAAGALLLGPRASLLNVRTLLIAVLLSLFLATFLPEVLASLRGHVGVELASHDAVARVDKKPQGEGGGSEGEPEQSAEDGGEGDGAGEAAAAADDDETARSSLKEPVDHHVQVEDPAVPLAEYEETEEGAEPEQDARAEEEKGVSGETAVSSTPRPNDDATAASPSASEPPPVVSAPAPADGGPPRPTQFPKSYDSKLVRAARELGVQVPDVWKRARETKDDGCPPYIGLAHPSQDARQRILTLDDLSKYTISLITVSYNTPRSLANGVGSWNASGLLDLVDERIMWLNAAVPEERALGARFGFRVLSADKVRACLLRAVWAPGRTEAGAGAPSAAVRCARPHHHHRAGPLDIFISPTSPLQSDLDWIVPRHRAQITEDCLVSGIVVIRSTWAGARKPA